MFEELNIVTLKLRKGKMKLYEVRLWLDSLIEGLKKERYERANPLHRVRAKR